MTKDTNKENTLLDCMIGTELIEDKFTVAKVCKHDKFQDSTVCKQKEYTILKFQRKYDNKVLYTGVYYSNMPIENGRLPSNLFQYRHLSDNTL